MPFAEMFNRGFRYPVIRSFSSFFFFHTFNGQQAEVESSSILLTLCLKKTLFGRTCRILSSKKISTRYRKFIQIYTFFIHLWSTLIIGNFQDERMRSTIKIHSEKKIFESPRSRFAALFFFWYWNAYIRLIAERSLILRFTIPPRMQPWLVIVTYAGISLPLSSLWVVGVEVATHVRASERTSRNAGNILSVDLLRRKKRKGPNEED